WGGFAALLALTVVAEVWVRRHPHFGWDGLPGFNAIYGFLVCAGLILAAKLIGLVLKRPDTYYSEDGHEYE
ncbi:MAG: hypothetical protein IT514_15070, partial [Burkholderiales bacterium]|nr:hypothetical protein [Burkholderiales bacterium]